MKDFGFVTIKFKVIGSVPWQQSVATRLIQIACCYGANIRSDLRVTTCTRLTRGNFTRRLGYRRAKYPAVALWWIIHELNCSICGLIIFTVVTDQHRAAISVQAVDDVGYSLLGDWVLQLCMTIPALQIDTSPVVHSSSSLGEAWWSINRVFYITHTKIPEIWLVNCHHYLSHCTQRVQKLLFHCTLIFCYLRVLLT